MPANPASRLSARHTSSGISPPSSGMSSFVHVIGLMPSVTMAISKQVECAQLAAQVLWRLEVNAVNTECCCRACVRRVVVDEHGFVRGDAIAGKQDVEDP